MVYFSINKTRLLLRSYPFVSLLCTIINIINHKWLKLSKDFFQKTQKFKMAPNSLRNRWQTKHLAQCLGSRSFNMASTTTRLPSWLLLSKDDIVKSSEWNDLTSELFDAVQQQLTESHVSYFSDLTDSEKIMFLDRAAKLVRDGSSYQKLVAMVSAVLDRNLNEEVTQTLIDPTNTHTKTQLLLQGASRAAINLLQRWPDLRSKLFACLNRPLPLDLRKAVWKMFLANPIVRKEYLENVSRNKRDTVSPHDAAIGQKCEAFLSSESSFQELASHTALLKIMKTSLSYRHVTMKSTSTIVDTDYLLALPLLKAIVTDSDVKEVDTEDIAGFIEVYFTFMESRPPLMKDSRSKVNSSHKKTGTLLQPYTVCSLCMWKNTMCAMNDQIITVREIDCRPLDFSLPFPLLRAYHQDNCSVFYLTGSVFRMPTRVQVYSSAVWICCTLPNTNFVPRVFSSKEQKGDPKNEDGLFHPGSGRWPDSSSEKHKAITKQSNLLICSLQEFQLAQKQYGNKMADVLDLKDKQLATTIQRILSQGIYVHLIERWKYIIHQKILLLLNCLLVKIILTVKSHHQCEVKCMSSLFCMEVQHVELHISKID